MKKVLATIAMLAIPGMAMAVGLIGDCYDCHTMHNSENGVAVAKVFDSGTGSVVTGTSPQENLLRLDCLACHAADPSGTLGYGKIWTMSGGSEVPQVAHGDATGDLAGGNFAYGLGANGSQNKVHNVSEIFGGGIENNDAGTGAPPGMFGGHAGSVFTGTTTFDQFGCAGAGGCHGTRQQLLTDDGNGTTTKRSGLAAIAGSHHNNFDGEKSAATNNFQTIAHDGLIVAQGYRFIPGLKGYGNTAQRWQNATAASHNEYYGVAAGYSTDTGAPLSSCASCHDDTATSLTTALKVPNNSMSGFCTTCHGNFHSAGGGDLQSNGVSGAFLRHPSDYVIPNSGEYANYQNYDLTAPVARPLAGLTGPSATVNPGTDMVMCLSCHQAHGSDYDYILRFPYYEATGAQSAGAYTTIAIAQGQGGCLACHTTKGAEVQPDGTRN